MISDNLANDSNRRWLSERILLIKIARTREINMAPEDGEYLKAEFLRRHPILIPRYSRDFPRLIALVHSENNRIATKDLHPA